MAGSEDDLYLPGPEPKRFAALEDAQILRWNRKSFTEESLQIVGPQPLGARKQLGRINHVLRAIPMDIHSEPRILADQRAGSAGMVQMNVREKNGIEISHADAAGLERLKQGLKRGTWAWVDNSAMPVRFQQARRNGTRPPHPEIVQSGDRIHGQR